MSVTYEDVSASYFQSISPSSSPANDIDDNGDFSIALYAIAIPICVWICAIGVCYPLTYCFYRFCLGIRIGKSSYRQRRRRRLCCCGDAEAADDDDHDFVDTISRHINRRRSSGEQTGSASVGLGASAGLPPTYDEALTMPKPQIGDSVRFQNSVDGGWCTFTWTDDVEDCLPPQYVTFCSQLNTDETTSENTTENRRSSTSENNSGNHSNISAGVVVLVNQLEAQLQLS